MRRRVDRAESSNAFDPDPIGEARLQIVPTTEPPPTANDQRKVRVEGRGNGRVADVQPGRTVSTDMHQLLKKPSERCVARHRTLGAKAGAISGRSSRSRDRRVSDRFGCQQRIRSKCCLWSPCWLSASAMWFHNAPLPLNGANNLFLSEVFQHCAFSSRRPSKMLRAYSSERLKHAL